MFFLKENINSILSLWAYINVQSYFTSRSNESKKLFKLILLFTLFSYHIENIIFLPYYRSSFYKWNVMFGEEHNIMYVTVSYTNSVKHIWNFQNNHNLSHLIMSTEKKGNNQANARKIICASKQNNEKKSFPTPHIGNLEPFDFVQRNVSP